MAPEEAPANLPDLGDSMDVATFEQILEMDDDEEKDFSKGIVFGFLEQAQTTFTDMDAALEKEDLGKLSSLGHFLKGSSATLGLTKIKISCEKIQHLGMLQDETGEISGLPEDRCLKSIASEIVKLRKEYQEVEAALKSFYRETS